MLTRILLISLILMTSVYVTALRIGFVIFGLVYQQFVQFAWQLVLTFLQGCWFGRELQKVIILDIAEIFP
jgi:hypothetical protein